MAYAMTKQGSLDNCVTYEFVCDTVNDMNAIENKYRTIGTVAIVLKGESGSLEVYMMSSNKEWVPITEIAGGSSGIALPTVTAQDEGKVLTVNSSGAWAAANASGGGSLVVHAEQESGRDLWVMDKTAGEIFTAYSAGTNIILIVEINETTQCGSIQSASIDDSYNFTFSIGGGIMFFYTIGSSGYPACEGGMIPSCIDVEFNTQDEQVIGDTPAKEIYKVFDGGGAVNFYMHEEGQDIIRRVVVALREDEGSYFFYVPSDTSAYPLFEFEASDGDSYPVLVSL